MSPSLIELVGARGVFAGVKVEIRVGEKLTVGRSRFVDLSAAKTPMARRIGRDRLEKNNGFRRMSRRHFEVAYESHERLVISDLSRNGVTIDGARVLSTAILDPNAIAEQGSTIRFGAGEELCLKVRRPVGAASP
jgi:pSer/pThr/pTyr-binding forkhead associated (FHA) protein